jgi:hypothetical protein
MTQITSPLHEDLCTFLIISRSVLHRIKNVSDKVTEKLEKTHYVQVTFFPENRAVHEKMWKNIVEWGRPQMAICGMRITCWLLTLQTHTQNV